MPAVIFFRAFFCGRLLNHWGQSSLSGLFSHEMTPSLNQSSFSGIISHEMIQSLKKSSFSGIISLEMIQPPNQSSLSDNIPQRDDSAFLKKENHPTPHKPLKPSSQNQANQNQAIKQPPPLLTKHFERERRGGGCFY